MNGRVAGAGAVRGWRTGRFWRRAAQAPALALACFLLGGCIYLRLLELKRQLADFDRYFEVDQGDGIKLTFKQPVLLDEDLAYFKLFPEKRRRSGTAEKWLFRWIKDYAARGEKPDDFEVTADLIFSGHKLTRVLLPERIFTFMPKPVLLGIVKSFGRAKFDPEKKTATAEFSETTDMDAAMRPLTRAELAAMLGAPMQTRETGAGLLWLYRYRGASPDQRSGHIDIAFTLDPASQRVRRIQGVLFNSQLDIQFPRQAAPPAAHPSNQPAPSPSG